jgi:hypothetical protein
MTRTVISKKANSKNIVYALVSGHTGFEVWKLCENYNGKVRGGIARTWRYVEKNMTEENAKKLFDTRTKS